MDRDDVLERLRGSGTLVARGRLTIDRSKAYEKMAEFQLPNPHFYVLRLIEAAHLLGTNVIHTSADADEFQLDADGVAFTADELEDLYHAALSDGHDARTRAMRQLAIGLTAAEGLDPAVVRVESHSKGHLTTLELTHDHADLAERVQAERHDYFMDFIRVYVRERFRPGHIGEFFDRVLEHSEPQEVPIIREHCRFSSRSVFVNGTGVGRGFVLPDAVSEQRDVRVGPVRGRVGTLTGERVTRLHLVQNGVLVRDYEEAETDQWAVRGVLDVSHLRKDLSQSDFIRNEAWDELTGELIPRIKGHVRGGSPL